MDLCARRYEVDIPDTDNRCDVLMKIMMHYNPSDIFSTSCLFK